MGAVLTVIGVLVAIIVGGLVFAKIHEATEEQLEGTGTTYPYTTINSTFTDNTDNWDNAVTDNSTGLWENISGNGVISDNTDNGTCEWYQSLIVSNIYDEVDSATITAKYQLSDNTALENLQIKVILDDGTDNNVILLVDNTLHAADNSTWYTVDNDVSSYITAAGTYYIRLWDNTERNAPGDNYVSVRWDNVTLTVNAYDKSIGEDTSTDIGDVGETIFTILPILALVGIIFLLMWTFTKGKE